MDEHDGDESEDAGGVERDDEDADDGQGEGQEKASRNNAAEQSNVDRPPPAAFLKLLLGLLAHAAAAGRWYPWRRGRGGGSAARPRHDAVPLSVATRFGAATDAPNDGLRTVCTVRVAALKGVAHDA